MRKESFYYDSEPFERCTLTTARRAYDRGEIVILAPVYASMYNWAFSLSVPICKDWDSCKGQTFKQVLNAFEFYNLHCGAGNYTKYFIKR